MKKNRKLSLFLSVCLSLSVISGNFSLPVLAYEKDSVNFEQLGTKTTPYNIGVDLNKTGSSSKELKSILPESSATKNAGLTKSQQIISPQKNYVEGEILIKYKNTKINLNTPSGRTAALNFTNSKSLGNKEDIKKANISVLKIQDNKTVEEKIAELKNDPNVEYVEPNYRRDPLIIDTNDTSKGVLWALDNIGQPVDGVTGTNDADIDAPEAWAISEGADSTIVAVIDSGVAYNHPDLIANMWDGTTCEDENGTAIPGGCNHGYDYEDGDNTPLPTTSSHGTHVAGTIAAVKNNGKGIIGVAPRTKIMAIKFGDDIASEIKAIDFAIQNGAKVINASFGGTDFSQSEYDAIDRFKTAGGIFVAAAGNESVNNESTHYYPSDCDLDNIVSVAATDQNDALASFSNYGATSVDVGAPGVNIYSTVADSTVMSENFNGVTAPNLPGGWVKTGNWGTYDYSGDKVLYGDLNLVYAAGDGYAFGPILNLSTNTNGATISFLTRCDTEYSTDWTDYMELFVTGDEWTTSTPIAAWDEFSLDNNDDPSGISPVRLLQFNLPANILTNNFGFAFLWHANDVDNNHDGCLVDDIQITKYSDGSDEKYDYYQGTSMAAPHVAGLVALIEGYNPNLTVSQVKNIILTTGDDKASLSGNTVSGKRINAQKALQAVNPAKAVTAFSFAGLDPVVNGVINEGDHAIALTVPFGTDVTALVPTIIITGASVNPASGEAQDFTSPVTYTVTAADSSSQAYTVSTTVDSDVAAVAADKAALVDGLIQGTNSDLANIITTLASPLPATGSNGSAITWVSNNTAVVSNDGQTVVRPAFGAGNATVTLTATLTKGVVTDTKIFTLTVLAETVNPDIAIAQVVIDQISALPTPANLVIGDAPAVSAARIAYDLLTADQKALVSNLATLEAAEAQITILQAAALALSNATDAVIVAETTPTQSNVDTAQLLVTALPDGTAKTALQGRINAVQAIIDLTADKVTAHDALISALAGYTSTDYTTDNWTTLNGFKIAGDTAIDAATDLAGVTLAQTTATNGMAGVQTIAQTPVKPKVPAVTNDDTANTVTGMAAGMEYNLDDVGYIAYGDGAAFALLDFSGVHTLLVRVAAEGINPASDPTTLIFTTNPVTLSSIAITTPATKLSYFVGESLNLTGLEVTGTYSDASTKVEIITEDNVTGFDSSTPADGQTLTITVDGKTATYTVDIVAPLSSAKAITSFNFVTPATTGVIDETAHTIAVTVPFGTVVTALVPTISLSGGIVSPLSGVAQDFTNPVIYTVTAENGSAQAYTVTVNVTAQSDFTALNAAVASAQSIVAAAVEGTVPGQYPVGSKAVLEAAISDAQGVSAFANQIIVDAAVVTLNTAIATFNAGLVGPSDLSGLTSAIASAQSLHNGATEGTAPGEYTVGSKTTLQSAIDTASLVTSAEAQSAVNAAVTTLNNAVSAFQASVIGDSDVSALNTAIASAQAIDLAAVAGTAPGQYPVSAKTTLETAIVSAQTLNASDDQLIIDAAVVTLNDAVTAFQATMIGPSDLSVLTAAIVSAQILHDTAVEGTVPGNHIIGSMTIYQTAINNASLLTVSDDQVNIDNAVSTLASATTVFNASVVGVSDLSVLTATIALSQTLHDGATEGTTPGQYAVGSKTTLQSAIDVASLVTSSEDQSVVDTAVTSLNTAVATFEAGMVPVPNITVLAVAITSAQTLHDGAVEGTDPGQYAVGSKATLQTAIDAATAVKDNPASTQADVDAAVITLNAAIAAFEAGKVPFLPNNVPVANAQSVSTDKNVAKSITLAATDADSDSLTFSVITSPSHGILSGTAPSLIYTPTTNYVGSDSFTFKANDGKDDSNTATVSIMVNDVITSTPAPSGGGGGTYYYTISASAGANGSISPTGSTSVIYGGSQTYTITPNSGYQVADILVDSVSKGAITTYTFNSVSTGHTISATFSAITTAKSGDANGDNKVDKYDFALMMANWGKTGSNNCDLNNDSKVDKYDFALLMLNWSK